MRRKWIVAGGALLLLLAAAWLGKDGYLRRYIYRPPPPAPVKWPGAAPQKVRVTTADGLALTGWYWPAPQSGELLLFFSGNGADPVLAAAETQALAQGGHGVLVASYRGYGGNPGSPSEAGLFADGDAWVREATRLKGAGKLYLFGHSLGGAVALEMAARFPVDGVVTLGTFATIDDIAPRWSWPYLPDRFDNRAAIARVKAPVFLLHGTADPLVPFELAGELRAASGNRAVVVPLPDEGHTPAAAKIAPLVWAALLMGSPPVAISPAAPDPSSSR